MSRIEVDKIQQQCGTTLTVGGGACKTAVVDATTITLGRCGGTVSLASGATQSGFGRTGTVDWDTGSIKTATFSAVSGKGYFADTSSGAFIMNLPAGSAGDIVSIADYALSFQTFNLTISPNGTEKIGGVNATAILSTEGQSVTLVYVDSTQGWVNTMDSTSNVRGDVPYMTATVSGACNTLVTCGNDKVATFVNPGTFCVSAAATCSTRNLVGYMVVAGGGGAMASYAGGGGGGGYREGNSPTTPYTASPLVAPTGITVSAQAYPITVGSGGAGANNPTNPTTRTAGDASIFDTITSAGGGKACGQDANPGRPGADGGSGGGNGHRGSQGGAGNEPPVSPPQGNNGGSSGPNGFAGDGGGGAGAVGGDGSAGGYSSSAGNGGAGTTSSINGTPTIRAGGGGGGAWPGQPSGSGGSGGGGAGGGTCVVGTNGTAQTGGGGGGGGGSAGQGGNGGSGIVIIRYKFQ